ncbi:GntR family transcriptional regulator [Streptomyces griseorubiginosus]|uniref:GntR family transcriptional regulator n=1 Tax=Streptomyces griseorubiginosus TaxID=67304 RepID=UPI0036E95C44
MRAPCRTGRGGVPARRETSARRGRGRRRSRGAPQRVEHGQWPCIMWGKIHTGLILNGEPARGERMPQDELARRFGACITSVREALWLLEAEGLVVAEPHRGVRVACVETEQVKGVYVMRRLAEGHAMKRATLRVSRRDLSAARALLDRLQRKEAAGDRGAVRELNLSSPERTGDTDAVAAAQEHIHQGFAAITEHLAGSSGPDPFDLEVD